MLVEMRPPDGDVVMGSVSIPDAWVVGHSGHDQTVVYVDPARYASSGFMPNVTITLAPMAPEPELTHVVTDETSSDPDGTIRRTRVVAAPGEDDVLMQLVATIEGDLLRLSIVCTATDGQWPDLAEVFDKVATSSTLVAGEED